MLLHFFEVAVQGLDMVIVHLPIWRQRPNAVRSHLGCLRGFCSCRDPDTDPWLEDQWQDILLRSPPAPVA